MTRIENNIELLSLHIPKTAGTSFRNILKTVYGRKSVIRFDINECSGITVNGKTFNKNKLSHNIKVAHGHFEFATVFSYLNIDNEVPVITWLRDPVERVISNYFYLKTILTGLFKEDKELMIVGHRMFRSLTEFAAADINRNRMSEFLHGASLKDFLFVGLVEYFDDDLKYLAEIFKWNQIHYIKHNATGKLKEEVPEKIKAQILKWNEKDALLYQEALELRKQRFV